MFIGAKCCKTQKKNLILSHNGQVFYSPVDDSKKLELEAMLKVVLEKAQTLQTAISQANNEYEVNVIKLVSSIPKDKKLKSINNNVKSYLSAA